MNEVVSETEAAVSGVPFPVKLEVSKGELTDEELGLLQAAILKDPYLAKSLIPEYVAEDKPMLVGVDKLSHIYITSSGQRRTKDRLETWLMPEAGVLVVSYTILTGVLEGERASFRFEKFSDKLYFGGSAWARMEQDVIHVERITDEAPDLWAAPQ